MKDDDVIQKLHEKINERNKLERQIFPPEKYLVLNGAGGGIACAACISLSENQDIIIDQTLYYTLVDTEKEAWYRAGLMNTDALTKATQEFNPEGELGPRHLHTLPNRIIPEYTPANPKHIQIADLAKKLSAKAAPIVAADPLISDQSKSIAFRRRRLRSKLKDLPEYKILETETALILRIKD